MADKERERGDMAASVVIGIVRQSGDAAVRSLERREIGQHRLHRVAPVVVEELFTETGTTKARTLGII
jgi:hypothetical protein